MTTAPVSHSNPKGKEKEKEQENEEQEKEKDEEDEKEKEQEKEEQEKEQEKEKENEKEQEKEKEKEKDKVKKKAKEKEKKQQYPFEGFNIDGEGSTELMSSFAQWINEGLYKHHAKKRNRDDHYLTNCSDLEFKQLDFAVAFLKKKDWIYVMSQPNKCWTDQKKLKQQSHSKYRYTTINCFFKTYIDNASVVSEYENKIVSTIKRFGIPDRTNWPVLESYQEKNKSHPFEVRHVTGIAQQASNSLDCGRFVAAYAEFLSDGLQARSGYVSNNEDLQRPRPKKAKFDENVVVTIIY
ncbi:hypothetical protein H5410_064337 [Solanum commersonii]|uniref:Ubiquitin-like protease family profile domain-containing protein n=1 Tax=Solanum commersonii TaxID=4109 RepID=A0A9J5VZQ5_SOLCO|nr:hypothetical protein H5410_064337 [Solanum commersonii]